MFTKTLNVIPGPKGKTDDTTSRESSFAGEVLLGSDSKAAEEKETDTLTSGFLSPNVISEKSSGSISTNKMSKREVVFSHIFGESYDVSSSHAFRVTAMRVFVRTHLENAVNEIATCTSNAPPRFCKRDWSSVDVDSALKGWKMVVFSRGGKHAHSSSKRTPGFEVIYYSPGPESKRMRSRVEVVCSLGIPCNALIGTILKDEKTALRRQEASEIRRKKREEANAAKREKKTQDNSARKRKEKKQVTKLRSKKLKAVDFIPEATKSKSVVTTQAIPISKGIVNSVGEKTKAGKVAVKTARKEAAERKKVRDAKRTEARQRSARLPLRKRKKLRDPRHGKRGVRLLQRRKQRKRHDPKLGRRSERMLLQEKRKKRNVNGSELPKTRLKGLRRRKGNVNEPRKLLKRRLRNWNQDCWRCSKGRKGGLKWRESGKRRSSRN